MTQAVPQLWTVVLNWKKPEMTAKCVHELLKTSYQNHSIVIVDNGSCDGSVEYLRRAFPSIPLIESEDNLGFSRGCNLGIKHALANGAEYVALINNDLILESDGYKEGMRGFEDDPSIGAVTGKIFTSDPHVLWQAGGYISRLRISGRVRGHFEIDRHNYDSPEFTGWASGAMSVFSADALNRVGLLPEEYFFGQEEWDISTNLMRNGFRIAYIPTFVGHHEHGGSYHRHPVLNDYGGTRNRLLYAEKYAHPLWLIVWKAMLWVHLRVVMPIKLRRVAEELPDFRLRVKAMQLAFSRHERGEPVTLDELRAVSAELDADVSWAQSVTI